MGSSVRMTETAKNHRQEERLRQRDRHIEKGGYLAACPTPGASVLHASVLFRSPAETLQGQHHHTGLLPAQFKKASQLYTRTLYYS